MTLEEAKDVLLNYTCCCKYGTSPINCSDEECDFGKAIKTLCNRPQGEWKTVEGYDGDEYYECSNCGEPWVLIAGTPKENNMNFCPNCGADMRKGGTE